MVQFTPDTVIVQSLKKGKHPTGTVGEDLVSIKYSGVMTNP